MIYIFDLFVYGRHGYGHTKLTPECVVELIELGDEEEADQLLVQLFHTKLHRDYVVLFEGVENTLAMLKYVCADSEVVSYRSGKLQKW